MAAPSNDDGNFLPQWRRRQDSDPLRGFGGSEAADQRGQVHGGVPRVPQRRQELHNQPVSLQQEVAGERVRENGVLNISIAAVQGDLSGLGLSFDDFDDLVAC